MCILICKRLDHHPIQNFHFFLILILGVLVQYFWFLVWNWQNQIRSYHPRVISFRHHLRSKHDWYWFLIWPHCHLQPKLGLIFHNFSVKAYQLLSQCRYLVFSSSLSFLFYLCLYPFPYFCLSSSSYLLFVLALHVHLLCNLLVSFPSFILSCIFPFFKRARSQVFADILSVNYQIHLGIIWICLCKKSWPYLLDL